MDDDGINITESSQSEPSRALRPRKPEIAALLSLLAVGLGQYYNGQFRRAGVFVALAFLGPGAFFWAPIGLTVWGAALWIAVVCVFRMYVVMDAWIGARRIGSLALGTTHQWYGYLAVILVIVLLDYARAPLNSAGPQRVGIGRMSDGSMDPGLLAGERFVWDPNFYEDNRPKPGEIVILGTPSRESPVVVKRCVAVEGDVVEAVPQGLQVNGRLAAAVRLSRDGGAPEQQPIDGDPVEVGPQEIVVWSDNTTASAASRNWSLVRTDDLLGKVNYILWSQIWSRIGMRMP